MLWQILSNIGFHEKESKIYLALLETSAQPASIVAKQSGINRTTTYLILEDLLKKGVVKRFERKGIQYFEAVDPKIILNILDRKQQEVEDQKNYYKNQIHKLESIAQTDPKKPRVSYFEGFEGVMNLYSDSLNGDHKEVISFIKFDKIPPKIYEYLESNYLPKRIEKNIFAKIISSKPPEDYPWMTEENQNKNLREIKFYEIDLPIQVEILIYQDKVSFISLNDDKPFGIQIKNQKITDSLKSIQELLWTIL